MDSITTQTRVIFPCDLNNHETLFGGKALMWMDEVAYITVLRYLNHNAVTIAVNKLNYANPVKAGDIIEISGIVTNVGSVKITVHVEIQREEMETGGKSKAIEADFVFAPIDENHKPVRVPAEKI
ncbi:MAG: hypothetical protein A2W93_04385 [Bacteroidetes bacterium GWF2_43_63]|nr:MAG: hypothetical protein A2W94_12375 [Bacteroidetes bacterium GWE2_42_42]OFY56001.1 MAG: hypothetical protein A2W93_04385 [Bacteroidetes bacterium GWF2_43_63]HBG70757.1 acyl-CoA thioesterase [Bacteroidales bacterium]HCB62415.1 acyl-CoA thioesterase [Bacteroidales bacterium]HCY21870.1 acyl-CoA thioesterase [Bacteroidales bacterium]